MDNSIESILNEKRLRICVLGKTMVGKTCLINRFLNGKYQVEHDRTIEENYSKYLKIREEECMFEIIDTGGLDEYLSSLDIWINNSDGFLLVYSINDKDSFDGIKMRYENILKYKRSKKFTALVVGNKTDLENGEEKEERKVNKEEVDKFCEENNLKCIEVSAKNNDNKDKINQIFKELGENVYDIKYSRRKGRRRFCCFC